MSLLLIIFTLIWYLVAGTSLAWWICCGITVSWFVCRYLSYIASNDDVFDLAFLLSDLMELPCVIGEGFEDFGGDFGGDGGDCGGDCGGD